MNNHKDFDRWLRETGAHVLDAVESGAEIDIRDATRTMEETARLEAFSNPFARTRAVQFAAGWARTGFASVDIGHKLAASLAWSTLVERDTDELALPFDAFCVRLPRGVFVGHHPDGTTFEPEAIYVARDLLKLVDPLNPGALWGEIWLQPVTGARLSMGFDHVQRLIDKSNHPAWESSGHQHVRSHDNENLMRALGRLICGVVCELNHPRMKQVIRLGPPSSSSRARRDEPKRWTFRLTRDVKVDCRAEVRESCLAGHGSPPRVRYLTRGHWQRYHIGPAGSEVEWRHKEPFWNGTRCEDAPIAVRAHVLGEPMPMPMPMPTAEPRR